MLCGIAGALYVPQVGIINPSEMSPANSIEIAIWVAVGGRGTLIGPVIGAALVNLCEELFHRGLPRILAVLPRRAVHRRDAVAAAGRGRAYGKRMQGAERSMSAITDTARAGVGKTIAPVTVGHMLQPGARHLAQGHPLSGRHHGQLRRLQGAEQANLHHRRRRAALHHRPQRRRQDHHDGCDHRQDAARYGHLLFRPDHRSHHA